MAPPASAHFSAKCSVSILGWACARCQPGPQDTTEGNVLVVVVVLQHCYVGASSGPQQECSHSYSAVLYTSRPWPTDELGAGVQGRVERIETRSLVAQVDLELLILLPRPPMQNLCGGYCGAPRETLGVACGSSSNPNPSTFQ